VQTNDIDTFMNQTSQIEQNISIVHFEAQFIIFARLLGPKKGELRVYLVTEEYAKKGLVQPNERFIEVARSKKMTAYQGQTLNVRLCEDINASARSHQLKMTFEPFKLNTLQFKMDLTHLVTEKAVNGLVSFVNDRPPNFSRETSDELQFCFLEFVLGPEVNYKHIYLQHTSQIYEFLA